MPRIKCETSPQRHIWAKMHQFTSCSLHRAFPSCESFVQLALESVKYDWMLFKRFQNTPLGAWGFKETSLDTSKGGQSRRVPCRYGGGSSVRPFGQVCSGHIGNPLCKDRPTGKYTWLKTSSVCGWWKQGKLLELLKKKLEMWHRSALWISHCKEAKLGNNPILFVLYLTLISFNFYTVGLILTPFKGNVALNSSSL